MKQLTVAPLKGAYYSKKLRASMHEWAVPDLDTVESLWGSPDASNAFRNVLVGDPQRRAEIWQSWLLGGQMVVSEKDSFYLLRHDFSFQGKAYTRYALLGAVEAHSASVLIHEDVLAEGVERARQATEACEGDVAAIFVGCREETGDKLRALIEKTIAKREPLLRYAESPESTHQLWEIQEKLEEFSALFQNEPLFLLDGHHRLAAARENLRRGMGDGRILACICSMAATDTLILPIHRIVYYEPWLLPERIFSDFAALGGKWKEEPTLKPEGLFDALSALSRSAPACLTLHAHTNQLMRLSFPGKNLAVEQLEQMIQQKFSQARVIPVADVRMALEQLAQDQAQVAFFMPPLTAKKVQEIASAHKKLPRKSTRFVPKPALGLLCRPWSG